MPRGTVGGPLRAAEGAVGDRWGPLGTVEGPLVPSGGGGREVANPPRPAGFVWRPPGPLRRSPEGEMPARRLALGARRQGSGGSCGLCKSSRSFSGSALRVHG